MIIDCEPLPKVEQKSILMSNVFSTVRKFYGLLIMFKQLIFKCVINYRDEVVEIK